MKTDFETIIFKVSEGVAHLTLNRPPLHVLNIGNDGGNMRCI
ncbi:enoyl-CoA hydratase/carnithine racemase [Bacillus thermophilus]|uniref:Enoyl-CoA hydratase/carnithine racemase n=1 Tax=Siminovitchia thermophila TaxID=1245522 RepID=A0ABS2RBQ7_9BACI|nr:hypothetical protein [Siminovitchia thermophila]MBM7717029.1 enoyl-CoA hydratase/carnithine racemase [Siminovitchia thermophila]